MTMKRVIRLGGLFGATAATVFAAETAVMPVCCVADFEQLEPVAMSGITSTLARVKPDAGGPALKLDFEKQGDERRFIALATQPKKPLASFKALDIGYTLAVSDGLTARFAVIAYEVGGGAWCRVGRPLAPTADMVAMRFPLQGLREAAFSTDSSGALEWDRVDNIWVGFVVDGKGSGSFEFRKLQMTSEPYRPTESVSLFKADPSAWRVTADPAVKQALATVDVEGHACLQESFTFPGNKHMYFTPSIALGDMEYSAYAGISFTYKATTPEGVAGLLISVFENGGQFVATPAPEATGEWTKVVVPWDAFVLGAWSKDDNGKLDPDAIRQLSIGAHGTATGKGGEGEIVVQAIDVVPTAE